MGKHSHFHGFSAGETHARGEDTSLAAVLLEGGIFERVDAWTPVDEVLDHEPLEIPQEKVSSVLVPAADYEWMMALANQSGRPINAGDHRDIAEGSLILTEEEMRARIMRAKVNTLMAFLRYVWFNAGNVFEAMLNLTAITLHHRPDFLKGMSQEEAARLFGYKGRAGFNAHSMKLVRHLLERWGVTAIGGAKSKEHNETKSAQMKGRRHRAEDYVSDKCPDGAPKYTKRQLREMAEAAEQQRLEGVEIR